MSIEINGLKLSLDESQESLLGLAAKELKLDISEISDFKILKESVDARRSEVKLVYKVSVSCKNESNVLKRSKSKNAVLKELEVHKLMFGEKPLIHRPVVVGSGPAGLFCALRLAEQGYKPLLLERGQDVRTRSKKIGKFWETGELDPDTNVQFGEGGAGTFSDGKLTTRIKDHRCGYILETFVSHGAPPEIEYSSKPHIGTDILIDVVERIRNKIVELGGEVQFGKKVTDIVSTDGKLSAVVVNESESIPAEVAVFAIGHSARDTYEMLYSRGFEMTQKPFAVGVRVEHKQSMIDQNQYGSYSQHPKLKSAEYKLTHKVSNGRSCYSFCMCPGGTVVAASSEEGHLVVNGMSEHARDKENANSAIVVSVSPEDFNSDHPLAGMEFQRSIEKSAFELTGGSYKAPVQLLGDFLKDMVSTSIGHIVPSCPRGYEFKNLRDCLPDFVTESIAESMKAFDRKIKGFGHDDVVLTGVETRTSAPVRIARDSDGASTDISGVYPCGEGAGYAGGIVSAGVDGVKVAESIMSVYSRGADSE
ncbi:hypothetical protein EUAN_06650 [Andreesenia angusta]|uniref:FAD-dependent protein C-terminal domain-containing protein n=1 Tax=Andreesenia angusta TaxID=39480 RepID=A0A1S1V8D8_9FIRM|nr:FAD-binding protein [Andreesenia angusta]OHW62881.1 hypothetical protein EUAN_06650 [Andreesenia angusta]